MNDARRQVELTFDLEYKMKRMILLIAVLVPIATYFVSGTSWAQDVDFTVEPRGLRIIRMPRNGESGMRPFNWPAGTNVVVQIESEDAFLVDYDRRASKITKYVDDVGTDLRGSHRDGKLHGSEVSNVKYSRDRRASLVELFGSGVPAGNSSSIHIEGQLRYWQANKKVTHRSENVRLVTGEKVHVGELELTIGEVGKPDSGRRPLSVQFTSETWLTPIAAMRFLDRNGREIKSDRRANWRVGIGPEAKDEVEYHLAEQTDIATIEVEEWQGVKPIEVQLNVSTRLGLSKHIVEETDAANSNQP
jgi:hypothetical protein